MTEDDLRKRALINLAWLFRLGQIPATRSTFSDRNSSSLSSPESNVPKNEISISATSSEGRPSTSLPCDRPGPLGSVTSRSGENCSQRAEESRLLVSHRSIRGGTNKIHPTPTDGANAKTPPTNDSVSLHYGNPETVSDREKEQEDTTRHTSRETSSPRGKGTRKKGTFSRYQPYGLPITERKGSPVTQSRKDETGGHVHKSEQAKKACGVDARSPSRETSHHGHTGEEQPFACHRRKHTKKSNSSRRQPYRLPTPESNDSPVTQFRTDGTGDHHGHPKTVSDREKEQEDTAPHTNRETSSRGKDTRKKGISSRRKPYRLPTPERKDSPVTQSRTDGTGDHHGQHETVSDREKEQEDTAPHTNRETSSRGKDMRKKCISSRRKPYRLPTPERNDSPVTQSRTDGTGDHHGHPKTVSDREKEQEDTAPHTNRETSSPRGKETRKKGISSRRKPYRLPTPERKDSPVTQSRKDGKGDHYGNPETVSDREKEQEDTAPYTSRETSSPRGKDTRKKGISSRYQPYGLPTPERKDSPVTQSWKDKTGDQVQEGGQAKKGDKRYARSPSRGSSHQGHAGGELPFACAACGARFAEKISMEAHTTQRHRGEEPSGSPQREACSAPRGQPEPEEQTKDKPYKCPQCPKSFSVSYERKRHVFRTHTQGERPHACPHCSRRFYARSDLAKHLPVHTGEKPYKCPQCPVSFRYKSDRAVHTRKQHPTTDGTHACPQCTQRFDESSQLRAHLRDHTREQKPFACPHCTSRFSTNENLETHMRKHTGERPFACPHCSSSFSTNRILEIHMRKHTGQRPFACPHCTSCFPTNKTLKVHMRTHTGEKPYACPHCTSRFAMSGQLKNHVRIHTGERPFACPHCELRFKTTGHLTSHVRSHTGEKPFACPHCSGRFTRSGHLKTHLRTHSGEKPYACPHCTSRFAMSGQLKSHVRTHTGEEPYACPHCDLRFKRKGNLTVHVRTHTRERPFSCPHCPDRFRQSGHLKTHLGIHTGE